MTLFRGLTPPPTQDPTDLQAIMEQLRQAGLEPPPPDTSPAQQFPQNFGGRFLEGLAGMQVGGRPGFLTGLASGLGSAGSRLKGQHQAFDQAQAQKQAAADSERLAATREYRKSIYEGLSQNRKDKAAEAKAAAKESAAKAGLTPGTPEYRAHMTFVTDEAKAKAAGTPKDQSQEPLIAIEGPNGPTYVVRSQAVGQPPAKTTQNTKPRVPSAAERDALVNDLGILGEVGRIRDAFKGHEGLVGPASGRIGAVSQMLGVSGLLGRQGDAKLRSRIAGLRNQILKARSGGAVTDGEASRLLEELPTTDNPSQVFLAKMNEFENTFRSVAESRRAVYEGTGVDLSKIPTLPSRGRFVRKNGQLVRE